MFVSDEKVDDAVGVYLLYIFTTNKASGLLKIAGKCIELK